MMAIYTTDDRYDDRTHNSESHKCKFTRFKLGCGYVKGVLHDCVNVCGGHGDEGSRFMR